MTSQYATDQPAPKESESAMDGSPPAAATSGTAVAGQQSNYQWMKDFQ